MPEQNWRRAELKHPEKVLGVAFISNDQTPEVLQPRVGTASVTSWGVALSAQTETGVDAV